MSRPDDRTEREALSPHPNEAEETSRTGHEQSHSGSAHHAAESGGSHHRHSYGSGSHSSSSHSGSGSGSHSSSSHSGSGGGSHSSSSHSGSGSGSHSSSSHSGSGSGSHSGSSRSGSGSSSRRRSGREIGRTEQQEDRHHAELTQKYQVVSEEDIQREKMVAHHHHHHHRSRRRRIRRAVITAACIPLALVLVLASVAGVLSLVGRFQVREDAPGIQQENPYAVTYDEGRTVEYDGKKYALNEDIVTIAALGLDRTQFGLRENKIGTAGQADLILIAALDLRTGLVRSLMIPRDTMVDVDQYTTTGEYIGVERAQICLSFAYGDGRETSSQNVLTSVGRVLYGIPVSLYGVLDLDGIAALNDAVGGVSVTLQAPYGEYYTGDRITLHGEEAQAFVRSRDTTILESDTYRRARQIQYLHAFTDEAVRAATKDIGSIGRLYNAAMEYAFTNVSLSRVMYLATVLLAKGVQIEDPIVLAGHMQEGDPYSEYILDEQAVFESVLKVFYTPVEG